MLRLLTSIGLRQKMRTEVQTDGQFILRYRMSGREVDRAEGRIQRWAFVDIGVKISIFFFQWLDSPLGA
jgi:hypothetical protein